MVQSYCFVVSCISTIVAGALMEVYNSPLKLKSDRKHKSWDMTFSKSWLSIHLYYGGQPCAPQCKMNGKTMILKIKYLMICSYGVYAIPLKL